jgi:SPX domain protein involved in polyphosphate accumulation
MVGNEYLTPLQRDWSIEMTKKQIELVENHPTETRQWKGLKSKELRLVLKIKLLQDRMLLEDKVRKVLKQERVGGNYQPDQVAKVIGCTERQAVVIERKALAKLKSPKLGRQIRRAVYE